MTVTVTASGSQTATISTEHTLLTETNPGIYLLVVDLSPMLAGDSVELRIYGKAGSGDAEQLLHRGTYGPVPSAVPLVMSVPIVSPHHYRATLKQIAGTGRGFPWAVYET